MISPYTGDFRVSQVYHTNHTGLDLVGVTNKEIYSTCSGKVVYAGWENNKNHSQGFGLYVVIKDEKTGDYFYYGHLSELKVKTGEYVNIKQLIGIEGSTGHSTGSHCHYEVRKNRGVQYKGTVNVSDISGIPNKYGIIYNDHYVKDDIKETIFTPYLVKINVKTKLNVRNEPSTSSKINMTLTNGVYTIVEERYNEGRFWGKLKSGVGWIALEYTKKV